MASQDVQQREYPSFEEEEEDDGSPDSASGFRAQARRELRYLQQGKEVPDTKSQMASRLGRFQGRFEEQMTGISSIIRQRAVTSQFLADCACVRDGNSTWDDEIAHPKIAQSMMNSLTSHEISIQIPRCGNPLFEQFSEVTHCRQSPNSDHIAQADSHHFTSPDPHHVTSQDSRQVTSSD
jgi:hypothetical protein